MRELRNLLTRAVVLSNTAEIGAEVICECLEMTQGLLGTPEPHKQDKEVATETRRWVDLRTAERDYLQQLMEAHDDDKEAVAKIAGISVRSLYRKLG